MEFKLVEMFHSVQGEGPLTGVPSVFIRLADCNLRCSFCDTHHSWMNGTIVSGQEIIDKITECKPRNIVFTGGEPLLKQDKIKQFITEYATQLLDAGVQMIEIETNGTIPIDSDDWYDVVDEVGCIISFNVSLKLSNSGVDATERFNLPALASFVGFNTVWKFVSDGSDEVNQEILTIVDAIGGNEENEIFIMPEGQNMEQLSNTAEKVIQFCLNEGFTFCQRVHITVWGDKQGV